MTTRGFKEAEARLVGQLIADLLDAPEDEATSSRRSAVGSRSLARDFPVYG